MSPRQLLLSLAVLVPSIQACLVGSSAEVDEDVCAIGKGHRPTIPGDSARPDGLTVAESYPRAWGPDPEPRDDPRASNPRDGEPNDEDIIVFPRSGPGDPLRSVLAFLALLAWAGVPRRRRVR